MKRPSVADHVFEALALAILEGRYEAGSAFPPERVIAEEFDCSRIVARQAIHRLADLQVLKVRQGAGTLVLGAASADIRLLEVLMRLQDRLGGYKAELDEHELLYGVGPLTVCAVRASDTDRAELLRIAVEEPDDTMGETFWRLIVDSGRNRIYQMEVLWWTRINNDSGVEDIIPVATRRLFYKALAEKLVAREDPVPLYLTTVRGLLGI